jgi:hypothetical protein
VVETAASAAENRMEKALGKRGPVGGPVAHWTEPLARYARASFSAWSMTPIASWRISRILLQPLRHQPLRGGSNEDAVGDGCTGEGIDDERPRPPNAEHRVAVVGDLHEWFESRVDCDGGGCCGSVGIVARRTTGRAAAV